MLTMALRRLLSRVRGGAFGDEEAEAMIPTTSEPAVRDVRFALVRCHGESEEDRIECLGEVCRIAASHGANIEKMGEVCVLTYGAFLNKLGTESKLNALAKDLCTSSRPAAVVHGTRTCIVGFVGGDLKLSLQTRIPGFQELMFLVDGLGPGEARAV